jgi:hypothetical protein
LEPGRHDRSGAHPETRGVGSRAPSRKKTSSSDERDGASFFHPSFFRRKKNAAVVAFGRYEDHDMNAVPALRNALGAGR